MPVLSINLNKRLAKIHKPRRRALAIDYIRERAAKLMHADKAYVLIDPELNRKAQLAARNMEKIKIEVEKEGEFIRAKLFKEEKKSDEVKSNKKENEQVPEKGKK
jgi:ribosomal protein L31E